MSLAVWAIGVTLFGRLLLTHFERDLRVNALGLLALSYILGIGAYTWVTYLFMLVGGKYTLTSLVLIGSGMIIVAYLLRRKNPGKFRFSFRLSPQSASDWGLMALLVPLLAFCAYVVFWTPIYWSDSIAYYDGVGRMVSKAGTLYAADVESVVLSYGAPSLLVHIFHATAYLLSEDHVGVLYSGYYIALVLMFAFLRWENPNPGASHALRTILSSLPSRLLTICVATTPFVFAMGYVVLTSLPAAVYLFAGVVVWKRFVTQPSRRLALLSGMLIALSSWTRVEALYFYLPVTLITLAMATVDGRVRRHVLAFVLPLLAMNTSRYAFVVISGHLDYITYKMPIYLDMGIPLIAVVYAILVTRVGEDWRERLAWGVLGVIVFGLLGVGGVAVLNFEGVRASSIRLWLQISDPVWGLAAVFSSVALFSPSLFRGTQRLLFVVILAMVALRILLYAHIVNINQSDTTILQNGNRSMLYIWPLLLYWVSCSRELRGLFVFAGRMPRSSDIQQHS
ncbi:MAG: hypothetical protein V1724_01545 [Chloroflexota bacterium]